MNSLGTRAGRGSRLGLLLLSACASRDAHVSYPANAPSSAQAPEAAPAEVTLALSGEPPLPSASGAGWRGLASEPSEPAHSEPAAPTPQPAAQPMHHEGHHHGAH